MAEIETFRQKAITESQAVSKKSRFGLFSHPVSTAVGDNGPYKPKIYPKNQQGKPITKQRNIQVSPNKSGQLDSSYFGRLSPLAASEVKDLYIQPERRVLMQENKRFKEGLQPQIPPFKPNSNIKTLSTISYPYTEEKPLQKNPKRHRQKDGRVKVGPPNLYTNSQTKIINSFFKPIEYMSDPYDRAHKIEIDRQKRNKSLQGEAAFKPNSFIPHKFSNDMSTYGEDVQLKPHPVKQAKFNGYNHEKAWKASSPGKSGLSGYFQPFPKYIENPPKQLKRKSPDQKEKQAFKSMSHHYSSQPSPSITKHQTNLRRIANIALRH